MFNILQNVLSNRDQLEEILKKDVKCISFIKQMLLTIRKDIEEFFLPELKNKFLSIQEKFDFDRIFDVHMVTLQDKNKITFEHFGVTTNLSGICCKHDFKPCFVIRNEVHANLAQNNQYNSLKYDENNLCFVMALQNFGFGFTEAQYILNFLGISVSKSFLRKTLIILNYIWEQFKKKSKNNLYKNHYMKKSSNYLSKSMRSIYILIRKMNL